MIRLFSKKAKGARRLITIVIMAALSWNTCALALEKWLEPVSGMAFIWLDGGCFQMGQSKNESRELLREAHRYRYDLYYSDELPQHRVCVSGFWLASRETTQHQWKRVMDDAPFKPDLISTLPAQNLSWNDAIAFTRALEKKNGATTFRLPTEAEWEYAARGGTDTPFAFGSTISTDQANYNGLYIFGDGRLGQLRESATPVGTFPANPFGLYDMHGNVWEWCNDWYRKNYYRSSPEKDPPGPTGGEKKVLRGGSWYTKPRSIRSANRYADKAENRVHDYGMRIVAVRPGPMDKKTIDLINPADF